MASHSTIFLLSTSITVCSSQPHAVPATAAHDALMRSVFLWERTADGWQDAAEKLDVLTQCEQGHHYLDADDDHVVVEVSRGEYGDDWWHTHG